MSNDTKEWLTKTNLTLKPRVNGTMFMTTVALRWDPDLEKMFYTGAGHEHILIFRAYEGVCEAIASGGIALGMTDDISEIAKEKELNLKKDDVVVLYTDGIPEARNQSSEMFTLNRLKDAVTRNGKLGTAAQVFEGIAKDFRAFVGEEPQLDDITLIVMRYTGVPVAEVGKTTETSWGQI
jgi:sigma-B regulation protein RsbU (phosphoserine phosphatase)